MVKSSSLSPPFCECLLLWAQLRAKQQLQAMWPDSLPCQSPLFCDRAWLVKKQAPQQAKTMQRLQLVMPTFELSCACDVLPAKALLQATRPGWAIALAQRKRWQVLLQRRK
jgi:hypothetical protein